MSCSVEISESAEKDLRGIFEYVTYELERGAAAKRILSGLMSAIGELADNPERWSPYPREPWRTKGVRTRIVGSYVIFFTHCGDVVSVGRILHCRRDFDSLLGVLR